MPATLGRTSVPSYRRMANVVIMDASHSDPAEAYAAVDLHASGDYMPYIYRTRDFGAHWDLIVNGLPTGEVAGSFARVVKEDTVKKGLLFAGTESSVYVSFDDGDHWQSLKLNLPIVSYRDLVVHDNDVVVGTFGRSFWILDDIAPLRQITADWVQANRLTYSNRPTPIRMRKDVNRNTPLPPEIPHGLNPPYGAIMYYYLGSRPQGEIKLQIYDSSNNLVRTLSTAHRFRSSSANPPPNVPDYSFEEPQPMSLGARNESGGLGSTLHEHPPSLIQNYSLEKFDALLHDTPYMGSGGPVRNTWDLHSEADRRWYSLDPDIQRIDRSEGQELRSSDSGRSGGDARCADEGLQVHVRCLGRI